jgi:hypothetical protein
VQLQKYAAILLGLAVASAVALSFVLGVSWNGKDATNVIIVTGVPLILGYTLVRYAKVPMFADFLTLSALVLAFSMVGAALAMLGTRSPAPVADSWLAAADDLLFISAADLVVATNQVPGWVIWALKKAYIQTGLYLYLTMIGLLLMERQSIAWRMFLIWGWSFLLISIIAFAAPALGCFSQLSPDQVEHLPKAAGRYAMRSFLEFRNSDAPVLALGRASGVITFPSFHVACALVLAQAWHCVRVIGAATKTLTGVIIFSCVPIGGHYLVDLAAGAAVWWCVTMAVDRFAVAKVAPRPIASVALSTA